MCLEKEDKDFAEYVAFKDVADGGVVNMDVDEDDEDDDDDDDDDYPRHG